MLKTKYIKLTRVVAVAVIAIGSLFSIAGCLEEDPISKTPHTTDPYSNDPFALFRIQLTLIDSETRGPLSDMSIGLLNGSFLTKNNQETAEQVTDSTGFVRLVFAATPVVPKEFRLSFADTTQTRMFQQEFISVFFISPVFSYVPRDATAWGRFYQGTTELSISRELRQIYYDE